MTRTTLFSSHVILATLVFTVAMDTSYGKGATPLPPGQTGAPDAATEQALRETQEKLVDPTKRAAMIKGDSSAEATDARVKSQLGAHTDGVYQISATVMETVVREAGGDPVKMQAIVQQLMANPHMLEKYLTNAERQQISQMAKKIEAEKGHAPASSGR